MYGVIFFALMLIGASLFVVVRYPNKYDDIIEEYCNEFKVQKSLAQGVIWAESKFKPWAKSGAGACGLMQLMPKTAEWCAFTIGQEYSNDKIFDERINIRLGVFYLSYLLKEFDLTDALAAYNAGEGNVSEWKKNGLTQPPFKETRDYIKRVQNSQKIYQFMYGD